MPNGGYHPGVPINWQNKPYSYRFSWTDGYYVWRNESQPSPYGSSDSEEAVENKRAYWTDFLLTEIRVSIKERRLLPTKILRRHKVVSRIVEFLGTNYDILVDPRDGDVATLLALQHVSGT